MPSPSIGSVLPICFRSFRRWPRSRPASPPAPCRSLCPAGKGEAFWWDANAPGFGLRAYASGKRLWIAQYRDASGRTRRVGLGDLRTVKLDEAREAARKLLSRVELGDDPQAERKAVRNAKRVSVVVDAYLAAAAERMKPRSLAETTRHLRSHAKPLHHEAAASVQRADVVKLLAGIARGSGPVAANRVRASLSAMWTWALRSGELDGQNPVANVPKPGTEQARDMVLSDATLALVWRATAGDHDHDRIVRLLLLTGARREEVGGLARAELDGAMWTLPAARSKNGLPHEVPLGPLALAQLPARVAARDGEEPRALVFGEGDGGFSGWSKCKARLDGRMGKLLADAFRERHGRDPKPDDVRVPDWCLHDLRRTLSTWLNENGTEPHVVEAVLNHISGAAKRGVAGVYNRALYREQKRTALARWEAHVRGLAGLPALDGGNVVPLRGAA